MTTEQEADVLIVDDDADYARALCDYLAAHGYRTRAVANAQEFDAALDAAEPSVVLLDQYLGSTTGTELLRRLRDRSDAPCIVVTGRSDQTERILNLELGADDEVDKSIAPRELLARIRVAMRRRSPPAPARSVASALPAAGPPPPGQWFLSLARRELYRPDGSLCHLTTAEFETLHALVAAGGKALSRAELTQRAFGRKLTPEDRAVDTAIRKLRQKIDPDENVRPIKTVRGVGYIFVGFS